MASWVWGGSRRWGEKGRGDESEAHHDGHDGVGDKVSPQQDLDVHAVTPL